MIIVIGIQDTFLEKRADGVLLYMENGNGNDIGILELSTEELNDACRTGVLNQNRIHSSLFDYCVDNDVIQCIPDTTSLENALVAESYNNQAVQDALLRWESPEEVADAISVINPNLFMNKSKPSVMKSISAVKANRKWNPSTKTATKYYHDETGQAVVDKFAEKYGTAKVVSKDDEQWSTTWFDVTFDLLPEWQGDKRKDAAAKIQQDLMRRKCIVIHRDNFSGNQKEVHIAFTMPMFFERRYVEAIAYDLQKKTGLRVNVDSKKDGVNFTIHLTTIDDEDVSAVFKESADEFGCKVNDVTKTKIGYVAKVQVPANNLPNIITDYPKDIELG